MFLSYLIFAFGFVLLVAGADWLIKGSSSLAKKFGLSEIVIGLTIVAFGTSAPELVVNIVSSLHGSGELVVGNIIGSNIANIALVLGLAGLIAPLAIEKNLVRKDIPLGILGVGAIYFLAVKNSGAFVLGRFAGVILILGFVIFLWLIYRSVQNKKSESTTIAAIIEQEKLSLGRALFFAVSGLAALTIGGQSVVSSATEIARTLGVSEKLIGLTLVAVGTSLPELVTSVVAVWKKKVDLAIGNVIGSNVFNVFWVLGASALINPIHFAANATTDLLVLTGLSLILLTASFIGKKYTLERWQATILLTSYCGYIGFIIWRG
ncbi:MAG: calcium/sodium antiporter [Patescibacteria group bacterium]